VVVGNATRWEMAMDLPAVAMLTTIFVIDILYVSLSPLEEAS
jgi:hypothetical protein